ncbi:MAG: transglutaminase-like cysteine peptidase [Deltaproteobacteria bacterium]|jgi:predicted transglutaminase-like cysteine proteinase|nr:transglutaminase-like cysteine peptidase [Deltaproteobacteria bacterium]
MPVFCGVSKERPRVTPVWAGLLLGLLLLGSVPFRVAAADAAPGAEGGSLRLFGTVEFRGVLKNMPKWQRVVAAEERSRTFDKDVSPYMRDSVYKQWVQLVERAKGLSALDKAKAVTAFFNRWPYRTDQDVYKLDDYWATPAEFMQKSGDCEDYAITKFYALTKLGVPADSMRIVALKDTIRNLAHAILVVYTNNDAYVLDNLTDMVLTHARYQHYNPQYSVNEVYRWAHVRPKQK